jgi:glucose-6-phosphate isomerase
MSNIKIDPFSIYFDLANGMSDERKPTRRFLSRMKGMYADDAAYEAAVRADDEIVYDFYELGLPETPGNLLFGTSIVYPGKVGNEYFMTKGHFHTILDTAEVYYCLSGNGYMLMENPEGDWDAQLLTPGRAVYVPGRYAHRSINIGDEKLVTFFVFRADAGHDYGTIETKGFRKLIVEKDGKPAVIDNPKWK